MCVFWKPGKPNHNGTYVAYVRDQAAPEWLRPMILSMHDGRWYFQASDIRYDSRVFGWSGPIPVGMAGDILPPSPQEFDL